MLEENEGGVEEKWEVMFFFFNYFLFCFGFVVFGFVFADWGLRYMV